MVRADGSSPSQMFFGRIQKQKLPLLNPNATSFDPDSLIKKRDDLHSKRCNLRDQHSVVIDDLVPGEKVLIQDYLSGLWSESATVLSMREDKRSYWVQDQHGRKFIRGRRRLKQISQPSSDKDATCHFIQINQVKIMDHSSSARSLKVKLHKLPPSVASEASERSLGINQHTLQHQEYMCIFFLTDKFYPSNQPSNSKYSVDERRWNPPLGFEPALQHYILSFDQLFKDSNVAANGLNPLLAVPNRPQRGLQTASPGLQPVRERKERPGGLLPRGIQGEMFLESSREPIIAQAFLKDVVKGDKRIILIDGAAVGAINRVPQKGETRSNMHVGGKAVPTELSDSDKHICAAIGPMLKARGQILVGIDVIGDKMTEINITSPTGIQELKRFSGIDAASLAWDAIIEKL